MMHVVVLAQKKPIIALILGVMLILIAVSDVVTGQLEYMKLFVLLFISLVLFGYSITYEITQEFRNWRHFKLFGFTLYKVKLLIEFPDYISVFSATHKSSADWGPVAAIGKKQINESLVVRFFTGRRHFTVYRTKSLNNAKLKASELSELLNVQLKK